MCLFCTNIGCIALIAVTCCLFITDAVRTDYANVFVEMTVCLVFAEMALQRHRHLGREKKEKHGSHTRWHARTHTGIRMLSGFGETLRCESPFGAVG